MWLYEKKHVWLTKKFDVRKRPNQIETKEMILFCNFFVFKLSFSVYFPIHFIHIVTDMLDNFSKQPPLAAKTFTNQEKTFALQGLLKR